MATTFTIRKKQKIFMLREYTKDASGNLVKGSWLADGATAGKNVK